MAAMGVSVAFGSSTAQPFQMQVTGSGTTRTLEIDVGVAGCFAFRVWIVDDVPPTEKETLDPPDGDDRTLFYIVTESDGTYTKTFKHEGAGRKWRIDAVMLGPVGEVELDFT